MAKAMRRLAILLCCGLAAHGRPLPSWTYNSSRGLNVAWFGSNASGLENAEQLLEISRYQLAIFGWQAFLEQTNYSHEAEELVVQARAVKARDPALPVAIYLDMELAEPFQTAVGKAMSDPSLRGMFLLDSAGEPMPCNVFCRSMPGMPKTDPRCLAYYWNWFNETAIQFYLHNYLEPIVRRTGFDAVFFDGADEWMEQRRTTWKIASNVPAGATDGDGLRAMVDVRTRTAQLLAKYGKYPIISEHLGDTDAAQQAYIIERMAGLGYVRYFEFFAPTQAYIEAMIEASGGDGEGAGQGSGEGRHRPATASSTIDPVPIICRQLISPGLNLTDSIAAYLIGSSNYSYYSASTGWFDKDWTWHDEYDLAVGSPLGPAVRHTTHGGLGYSYSRSFAGCDVAVNCTAASTKGGTCKGKITMKHGGPPGTISTTTTTSSNSTSRRRRNDEDDGYLFKFAPAARPADQALNIVNSSLPQPYGSATTWGGSVVADPESTGSTGTYHMWASTFVGPCGLSSWETNSRVVHAVSTAGPGGPYRVEDLAVPSYAHNPEVVWHPSERLYLLFTLGHPNASAPLACDAASKRPNGTWGGKGAPPWLSDVSLYTSRSASGPWEIALNASAGGAPLVVARGLNANPTAWVDPHTGEVTLLYGRFDAAHRRVYSVKTSKNAAGPWEEQGDLPMDVLAPPKHCSQNTSSPHYRCSCDNEDPFLYRESEEPRRWVLLFHQYERCPPSLNENAVEGPGGGMRMGRRRMRSSASSRRPRRGRLTQATRWSGATRGRKRATCWASGSTTIGVRHTECSPANGRLLTAVPTTYRS